MVFTGARLNRACRIDHHGQHDRLNRQDRVERPFASVPCQAWPAGRTQRPGPATERLQLAAADRLADPGLVQLNDGGEILVAVAFGLAGLEHAFGHVQHGGGDASAVRQ